MKEARRAGGGDREKRLASSDCDRAENCEMVRFIVEMDARRWYSIDTDGL